MSAEIDKYLLRAPVGDMQRWKNTARKRKVPFSVHLREALEAAEARKPTATVIHSPSRVQRAESSARAREAMARSK